jgi:hypothetical protein
MLAGAQAADNHEHSRVVCLMNMVTSDELINDEEYEGTVDSLRTRPDETNSTQKSKKTSKRSAASTDPLSNARFPAPPELASTSVLARFTSSTKTRSQHRRPSRRLPAASSHGEPLLRPSSRKKASTSRRGRRRRALRCSVSFFFFLFACVWHRQYKITGIIVH